MGNNEHVCLHVHPRSAAFIVVCCMCILYVQYDTTKCVYIHVMIDIYIYNYIYIYMYIHVIIHIYAVLYIYIQYYVYIYIYTVSYFFSAHVP